MTNLYYQDPKTDEVKVFTRKLLESAVKLGDALPCYDIVSTVGILRDVEEEKADLYATLEMAANTTKPMVILVSDEKQFIPVLDMLEYIKGYYDGTLSLRRSCAHGICGSDAMRINGRNYLACKALLKDLHSKKLTVEPILGLRVIKDLIVDMEQFFTHYKSVPG